MKYMLDTNICIFLIKRKHERLIEKFISTDPDEICISSITYAELIFGAEKSTMKAKNYGALSLFLSNISILNFDVYAAEEYGKIRTELSEKGMIIGAMDMLIASHAKAEKLILVTNNVREFSRVDGLEVEDWVT